MQVPEPIEDIEEILFDDVTLYTRCPFGESINFITCPSKHILSCILQSAQNIFTCCFITTVLGTYFCITVVAQKLGTWALLKIAFWKLNIRLVQRDKSDAHNSQRIEVNFDYFRPFQRHWRSHDNVKLSRRAFVIITFRIVSRQVLFAPIRQRRCTSLVVIREFVQLCSR